MQFLRQQIYDTASDMDARSFLHLLRIHILRHHSQLRAIRKAFNDSRPLFDLLRPCLHVGVRASLNPDSRAKHALRQANANPREGLDVRDTVRVASEVRLRLGETNFEDVEETLGLISVALLSKWAVMMRQLDPMNQH